MIKQIKLKIITTSVFIIVVLLFITNIQVSAQKKDYQPGDKIEYLASSYPKEVWEEGTFVHSTPDGTQPIIREKTNEFHKEGFQIAYQWAKIRPLSAKPNNETPVNTNQNNKPINDTEAGDAITTIETTNDFGEGLMTQAEVLSFLQIKLGDNPFQHPRREEIKKELAEMIKQRGLDFRFESSTDFYKKLGKYGATSDIISPLSDNYGKPTKESWLIGVWQLSKIGAAIDYTKNNRIYRQGEIGVGNVGALTLYAQGTYIWKSVTAQSISGKWRKATKEEMKHQGGDQIILLKAKSGYDWIVYQNRNTTLKGDWIKISELNTRQINEHGMRAGKK